MIHDVDLLVRYCDFKVESVEAYSHKLLSDQDDCLDAYLTSADGRKALIRASRVDPVEKREVSIFPFCCKDH